jgi:hypothetical protein
MIFPTDDLDNPDDGELLDAAALEQLGHTRTEINWLLDQAVHGSTAGPYLLPDQYQRLLVDLENGRPHQ